MANASPFVTLAEQTRLLEGKTDRAVTLTT